MRNMKNNLRSSVTFAKDDAAAAKADDSAEGAEGANEEAKEEPTTSDGKPAASGVVTPLTEKSKVSNIRKALGGDRVYFQTDESGKAADKATALLEKAMAETDNFYGVPYYVNSPESASIEDANNICVMTLGYRTKGANGYKAIVITQQPSVDEFLANPDAREFVAKLIQREASDVAFSAGIRSAETYAELENAVSTMPITVESIIVTQRESGGGLDTDTFDTIWGPFRTGFIKEKSPKLYEILPQKGIVLKALRSKAYANAHPACEQIEKAGMFAKMLTAMIKLAPEFKDKDDKPNPLDTSVLEEWLANRDSLVINYNPEVITKVDDLSVLQF